MKKFKDFLYWVGVLLGNVFAYLMLAFLFALSLGLPNEMWSAFVGIALVIFGIVFTADDKKLDLLKKFATYKSNPPDAPTSDGSGGEKDSSPFHPQA